MQTSDHALLDLYGQSHISYDGPIRNPDSANELRLAIKLRSQRGEPATASGMALSTEKEAHEEPEEAAEG